jgi:hypothetical protein
MFPITGSLLRRSLLTVAATAALSSTALHAAPLSRPPGDMASPVQTAQMKPQGMGMGMAMAQGSFRKAEAPVSGGFTISEEGGKKVLTLSSDFKTNDMAPDLKVIFSPSPTPLAATKAPGFPLKPGTYTILASLKSSKGAQSYVIPASIDLKGQKSVLIWCKKFNATMAWAPLKP